jgi:hypothetical protein
VRLSVLWVNKRMRSDATRAFLSQNSIVYKFTSHSTRIRTLESKAIGNSFFPLNSDIIGEYEPETLVWADHAEVLFEFRLQQNLALRDVRINVVELLCATLLARDSTTIRCRIVPPDGSDPVQTTFTLRSLRINVFLILSHVLEASLQRRSKRCPAVYINGEGFTVETINPGRKVSQLLPDAAKLISEQMKGVVAGEEYVRKFINVAPRLSSSRYLHVKRALSMPYPSLIGVWGRLRVLLVRDWSGLSVAGVRGLRLHWFGSARCERGGRDGGGTDSGGIGGRELESS